MEPFPTHLTLVVPAKAVPRGFSRVLALVRGSLATLWRALISRTRRDRKLLLVRETSALGDRRFVAVVQFERQRFLIGSSPSSVTLLARLSDASPVTETGGNGATPEGASQ